MTVSTTTSTVTYIGNGATTVFTFPFIGVSHSDLVVTYVDATGISTVLSPSVYTVLINAAAVGTLWGIGGSVTYPNTGSPPVAIAVGTTLTITRAVPYEQTISIGNQGAFYPQAIEQALDLLEFQIQQLTTDFEYTLQFPLTDPNPPDILPSYILRANGYLAFDANGQPYITTAPSVTPTPGTYATPRKVSTTGTTTVSVISSDSFGGVSVYQSSTPVTTIQLPVGYGPFPIFDGSLNSAVYPIKVLPPAGKTILGLAHDFIASNGSSKTYFNDGTQIIVG